MMKSRKCDETFGLGGKPGCSVRVWNGGASAGTGFAPPCCSSSALVAALRAYRKLAKDRKKGVSDSRGRVEFFFLSDSSTGPDKVGMFFPKHDTGNTKYSPLSVVTSKFLIVADKR